MLGNWESIHRSWERSRCYRTISSLSLSLPSVFRPLRREKERRASHQGGETSRSGPISNYSFIQGEKRSRPSRRRNGAGFSNAFLFFCSGIVVTHARNGESPPKDFPFHLYRWMYCSMVRVRYIYLFLSYRFGQKAASFLF